MHREWVTFLSPGLSQEERHRRDFSDGRLCRVLLIINKPSAAEYCQKGGVFVEGGKKSALKKKPGGGGNL